MSALILSQPFQKLLVIGFVQDAAKLATINTSSYDWIIVNGGICHPTYTNIKERTNQIQSLPKLIYVVGRYDLQCQDPEIKPWLDTCPNVVVADFPSRSVLIMDGGVPTNIRCREDVLDNWEISFVSQLFGKSWHHFYNGRLGYVISNNPIASAPSHFNYSMQLGASHNTYVQEIDEIGLKCLTQL